MLSFDVVIVFRELSVVIVLSFFFGVLLALHLFLLPLNQLVKKVVLRLQLLAHIFQSIVVFNRFWQLDCIRTEEVILRMFLDAIKGKLLV